MRIFVYKIGVFTLEFIALIIIPVLLISKYDNLDKHSSANHNIISLQNMSTYDSLDILFVGNSYCYSSINTNILDSMNISSYNLGIATAGVDFYELIINDYFKNISSTPDKTLLLVTPMTFSSESDNFASYPIHRYLENEKSNLEIAIKFDRFDELIQLYRKSFKKAFKDLFERRTDKELKILRFNNKGYFPNDKIFDRNKISAEEHLYRPFKHEEFNESKVEELLAIAKKIDNRGSEVIFYELPTNLLKNYFSDNYLSNYNYALDRIKDHFELIKIDEDKFSEKHYRNIDHMNSSGAEIATKELIQRLK